MKLETVSPEPAQVIPGDAEEQKHIDRLLEELYRQNKTVCELYSMLTLSALLDGHQRYDVDEKLQNMKLKDEIVILEPVFAALPGDSREFFRLKFAKDSKEEDDMYTKIMSRLKNLVLTEVSFFESIDYSKKKKER
jgi:hypothetical protein